jgi:parallel beta-helix repeat protein
MKTLASAAVVLVAFAGPVRAAQVYSGCSTPSPLAAHTWYVDPVNGKSPAAGGNGSVISSWNSISGIIDGRWAAQGFSVPGYTRPLLSSVPYLHKVNGAYVDVADEVGNPPVHPGDAIMLMSGNYGDVVLGAYNTPTINSSPPGILGILTLNSDWVTVQAALGQVPVFTTLYIRSTNKWVFNGIKVQSLMGANSNYNALVQLTDQGASYPTTDIVFENMLISSADSTAGWSQAQWLAQARWGFWVFGTPGNGTNGVPYTSCISLSGSHIQNVRFGAALAGNNLLFTNNTIDHFGDDGIDFAANNLAITHNSIHDNLQLADGNHEDAMQGQNGPLLQGVTYNAFSNILIDSNLIVRQTDPSLPFPTYLQGIDDFDEDWTNMTVTNNVVITSACHGIALQSTHNSLVADNTVVEDGLVSTPGCVAQIEIGGQTHEGPVSSNTVARNNLTSRMYVYNLAPGVTADHNVAMCCNPPEITWYVNGAAQFNGTPGTYTNNNIIDTGGATAEFDNFNPSSLTYDVEIKATAQALGAGTTGGPAVDIVGVPRTIPYTTGAYSFPY